MTNFMDLENLEDIEQRRIPIVNTEQIGILAAKRKPLKVASEVKTIERQNKTKCHCHHLRQIAGICYFGRCRHVIYAHPAEGAGLV